MKIIIINNSVCETFSGTIERCSRTGSESSVPDVGPVGLIIKAYELRKEFWNGSLQCNFQVVAIKSFISRFSSCHKTIPKTVAW